MSVKVVISGCTAAGKSTHARLLAADLGLPYVSATELLADLVAERTSTRKEKRWQPSLDAARRADESIDDELDGLLTTLFKHHNSGVFDACLLPWVAPDVPAIRVWIESDLSSRLRKCFVSHLGEGIGWDEASARVTGKDAFTEARLRKTRGCSYGPASATFEVVANNESLIPVPTSECAEAGIAAFQPVLLSAIQYAAGVSTEPPSSPWIRLHPRLRNAQ